MDESGVLLWLFNLRVWVAIRQYSNVHLRPMYIRTIVVKGINFNFVDKCDHALWTLNLNLVGYNLVYGRRR